MMIALKCKTPSILLLMLLFPTAHARSLSQTIDAALQRHPEAETPDVQRVVERGYRQQADSLLGGDPSINASVTGDRFGNDQGYTEYVAGISVPVQLPGQRNAKAAIADNLLVLATAVQSQVRWEVAAEVINRAWQLQIAQADLKEVMKQWAAARALAMDIEHRFEVGELSRNDVLLAQQDLIDAESAYQEAENMLEQTRLKWLGYTGDETLPDDLESSDEPASQADLSQHPLLLAALAERETARARGRNIQAQRRASPVLSLFAKRDRGDRREDFTDSLGLEVSLPLGTRVASAPAMAEAAAEVTHADSQARRIRQQLEVSLSLAEQALLKAERLLQLAQQKHEFSLSRLRLAQRAFQLGEMDLYQLLLARRQSYQATRALKLRRLEKQHAIALKTLAQGVIPE